MKYLSIILIISMVIITGCGLNKPFYQNKIRCGPCNNDVFNISDCKQVCQDDLESYYKPKLGENATLFETEKELYMDATKDESYIICTCKVR